MQGMMLYIHACFWLHQQVYIHIVFLHVCVSSLQVYALQVYELHKQGESHEKVSYYCSAICFCY